MSHGNSTTNAAAHAAKKSGMFSYVGLANNILKKAVAILWWIIKMIPEVFKFFWNLIGKIPLGPWGIAAQIAGMVALAGIMMGAGCGIKHALTPDEKPVVRKKAPKNKSVNEAKSTSKTYGTTPERVEEVPVIGTAVEDLDACMTPCKRYVGLGVFNFETDGKAIWVLPPGWARTEAVQYAPPLKKITLRGKNVDPGVWEFWSTTGEPVQIRFTKR